MHPRRIDAEVANVGGADERPKDAALRRPPPGATRCPFVALGVEQSGRATFTQERVGTRQATLRRRRQRVAELGIGLEAGAAGERDLEAREQRRGVHVVLQQLLRDDHVADLDVVAQAAGNAGEDKFARVELVHQQHRGGGGGDLADARQHQHHRLAVDRALVEIAPRQAHRQPIAQQRQQRAQLVVHRAGDGDRQARHLFETPVSVRRVRRRRGARQPLRRRTACVVRQRPPPRPCVRRSSRACAARPLATPRSCRPFRPPASARSRAGRAPSRSSASARR